MYESFTLKGIWWLPNKPEKKLTGILTIDPYSFAKLEVFGAFEEITEINKQVNTFEIINGVAGFKVTLYDCITSSNTFQAPGTLISTYFVNVVFSGHIFEKFSDIMFYRINLELSFLSTWANFSSLRRVKAQNDVDYRVEVVRIPPIITSIGNSDLNISLVPSVSGSINKKNDLEISLTQKTFLEIESGKEIHFENFLKISEKLQQFFTLAIDRPIQILEMKGYIQNQDDNEKKNNIVVEVFLPKQKELLIKDDFVHPSMMPFSLDAISERFSIILNKWFEKYEILSPMFNFFFAIRFNPGMNIEHKFLNLIVCIESYHRRVYGGNYLSETEYEQFVEIIKKSIPTDGDQNYLDFTENFIKSLDYKNELSLRRRLKAILSKNEEITSEYIKNKRKFIDNVVNTRNYFVHLDKKLEKSAVTDYQNLSIINLKLNFIVDFCLYTELEFGIEEIKKIFNQRNEYKELISNK